MVRIQSSLKNNQTTDLLKSTILTFSKSKDIKIQQKMKSSNSQQNDIKIQQKMKSSNSQQNDIMEQQNSRIAQIYERMLLGDRSALGNLQGVKISEQREGQVEELEDNKRKKFQNEIKSDNNNTSVEITQKKTTPSPYLRSPAHHIHTIHEELFQESLEPTSSTNVPRDQQQQHPAPNLHLQKGQNLSQLIKSKVTQLRNEKQLIKNQQKQEMQLNEIKKITKNIRLNVSGQSKSYDLVKRKDVALGRMSVADEREQVSLMKKMQAKQRFESVNINRRQTMKKTQSSISHDANKHLPPLYNQKRKAPTQNSEHNTQQNDSIYHSRHEIRTPISLANSNIEMTPKMTQKNQQPSISRITSQKESQKLMMSKVHPHNCLNSPIHNLKPISKVRQSLRLRVPIQQIKKQRQQLFALNQREIKMQMQIIQYHHKTKAFVQDVKQKYGLNYKNVDRLAEIKGLYLSPEPVLNKSRGKATNNVVQESIEKASYLQQQQQVPMKKKRRFDKLQQKITENKSEIALINELISRKKQRIMTAQQALSANNLLQYWSFHDLYTSDFEDEQDRNEKEEQQQQEEPPKKDRDGHSTRSSNIRQAYSTSMPHTKQKGWKTKAVKEYDTNRSFQEFAKSRGVMKDSKVSGGKIVQGKSSDKDIGLRRIEQDDQQENRESYRVTVDSRLRRLLVE